MGNLAGDKAANLSHESNHSNLSDKGAMAPERSVKVPTRLGQKQVVPLAAHVGTCDNMKLAGTWGKVADQHCNILRVRAEPSPHLEQI